MGTLTAGTIMQNVLVAVRDPSAFGAATVTPPTTASGQTFALSVINEAQAKVNAAEAQVVASQSVSVSAGQALVRIAANLPQAIRIVRVWDANNNELQRIDLRTIAFPGSNWFSLTGTTTSWGLIGHDLLLLYPAPTAATTFTVFYIQDPSTVALSQSSTLVLSDDSAQQVMDLAEVILLIKLRSLEYAAATLARLQSRYAKQLATTGGPPTPVLPRTAAIPFVEEMKNGQG